MATEHETDSESNDDNDRSWIMFAILLGVGVLAVSLVVGWIPMWIHGKSQEAGWWGDSFGMVNALMSGLAFAGVIVTLLMQRNELELQRTELRETRFQHQRMAKAQEESENRLLLTSYLNALDSFRELSAARGELQQRTLGSELPQMQGHVYQRRVFLTLRSLLTEIEPEIEKLYPSLDIIPAGSRQWKLEQLLSCAERLSDLRDRCGKSTSDEHLAEAVEEVKQIQQIARRCQESMNSSRRKQFDEILHTEFPTLAENYIDDDSKKQFWGKLHRAQEQLLSFINSTLLEL